MGTWKVVDGGLVSSGIVKDVDLLLQSLSKSAEERLSLRFFTGCLCPSASWTTVQPCGMREAVRKGGGSML